MSLIITIARSVPESTFTTVWSGDTCSNAVEHTLPESERPERPEYVRVPVFNALGAAIPRTVEYTRRDNCDLCHNCGDDCRNCPFPVW